MKKEDETKEFLELAQDYIVLVVPEETVEVEITAKIYHGGEIRTVSKHMGFQEVRAAIKEASEGYIPNDAVFSLVPVGEDKILHLLHKYLDENEIEDKS